MPRPKKCRRVCKEPCYRNFGSRDSDSEETVILNVDEYEVIRLIDFEKLTQEECASQMGIARTTVTEMYEQARFKVADCMVNGKRLRISGGNYSVCNERNFSCCKRKCHHNCRRMIREGEQNMKIAIPLDVNKTDVCPAFARTPYFMVYDKEQDKTDILKNPAANECGGAGGKAAQFMIDSGITTVITPRCGENAAMILKAAEIKIYRTNSMDASYNIKEYLDGKLEPLTRFHAGFQGKA